MRTTLPKIDDFQQSAILSSVKQSFQQYIEKNSVYSQKIWLACSGGRDSIVLLYACYLLALPIHVIHINHKIQLTSDDWQDFVEKFCQDLNIPYISKTLQWQSITNINEQHARQARYHAISQIVEEQAILALAHHADDQAETILINLCQGTGLAGLSGMQPFKKQQEFSKTLWLWRPLLNVSREQISQFAYHYQLDFVDDPTNIGDKNQRAWLRQSIMPLLKSRFNHFLANVQRTSQNIYEAQQLAQRQIEQDLINCQFIHHWTDGQKCLYINELKKLEQYRCFALLHYWIKDKQKYAPNRQFIQQVYQLIQHTNSEHQTILQWQGLHIRRHQQKLYFLSQDYVELLQKSSVKNVKHIIDNNQQTFFILQKTSTYQLQLINFYNNIHLEKIIIRPVLHGERFQRLGQTFHETLKKLAQRFHIPSWERSLAWVIEDMNQQKLAILLPQLAIWLHDASFYQINLQQPCSWQLQFVKQNPIKKTLNMC